MDDQELQDRIAAFPSWHYRFEFPGGVSTPVSHDAQAKRHEQRRRYFFDALLQVTGGSLEGHRVLDLGCNAGLWSLHSVEAGADFVLGIDARQTYIDQAELVFEAKGIDPARYRFEQGNIFSHAFHESFDVVLCLGIMDVTSKPVELFELMGAVGAEILVIDTNVSRAASSFFEISSVNDPRNVVDHELTLVPTTEAVIELADQFGFQAVPLAQNMTDYAGMDDYRHQRRMAFICAKTASLSALPRASVPRHAVPWWLGAINPMRRLQRLRG